MSDLFAPFKSEETTGKLPKEMEEKISETPAMTEEELKDALETRYSENKPTFHDVKSIVKKAADAKEREIMDRLFKIVKKVAEPEKSVFEKGRIYCEHVQGRAEYADPQNTEELEALRRELDAHYTYYRHNACFHPINGSAANLKRQRDLRRFCPSIKSIKLLRDANGRFREEIIVLVELNDSPKGTFRMSFDF